MYGPAGVFRAAAMFGGVLSMSIGPKVWTNSTPTEFRTVTEAVWFAPSEAITTGAGLTSTPETGSIQLQMTVTLWLVQVPATYGPRGVVAPTLHVGALLSMLIGPNVVEPELPATSIAVPVAVCPAPSEVKVCFAGQLATPDSRSTQLKVTVTSWFVQVPAVYGFPSAVVALAVIVGGVVSIFTGPNVVERALPATSSALPVAVCPAPSEVKVCFAGQLATPDSRSTQLKVTVTSWFVQVPAVYGFPSAVTADVLIVGAVLSSLTATVCEVVLPA